MHYLRRHLLLKKKVLWENNQVYTNKNSKHLWKNEIVTEIISLKASNRHMIWEKVYFCILRTNKKIKQLVYSLPTWKGMTALIHVLHTFIGFNKSSTSVLFVSNILKQNVYWFFSELCLKSLLEKRKSHWK